MINVVILKDFWTDLHRYKRSHFSVKNVKILDFLIKHWCFWFTELHSKKEVQIVYRVTR